MKVTWHHIYLIERMLGNNIIVSTLRATLRKR